MSSIVIFKRLLRQEFRTFLMIGIFYLIPLFIFLLWDNKIARNVIPFLFLAPLMTYPFFFFVRGITLLRKEWEYGTIIFYFSSGISPSEFEIGYIMYMLIEVFLLYILPVLFMTFTSHNQNVLVNFTVGPGVFFLPIPLFLLSYIFGHMLFLFSKGIYRLRNTLTFIIAILFIIIFFKIYSSIHSVLPSPFTFKVITLKEHIVNKGKFMFVYSLIFVPVIFTLNILLYNKAEY